MKRARDFAQARWRYGKKILLRILAPLAPVYNRLQTIWRKIFPRTTRVPTSADWLSRTAMAGAITFSVAFIADASINGNSNLLAVAGSATARTVFSQSVALLGTLSDVIDGARSGSQPSAPSGGGNTARATTATLSTGHTDSAAKGGSASGGSAFSGVLAYLKGTSHSINGLAGLSHNSSNHSGGSNKTGGLGSPGTTSGAGGGGSGSGGGGTAGSTKAGAGTNIASAANAHPATTTVSGGGTTGSSGVSTTTIASATSASTQASGSTGASMAAVAAAPLAADPPQYWDTATTAGLQAGNGNWSTAGGGVNLRWSNVITGSNPLVLWTNGNSAFFETNGTSLVTVNSLNMTVDSMTFDGTGYTIGPGAGSLSLVGTGAITTNANAIISAPLGGSVGLTKNGTAILTFSGTGANTYTGLTTINAGEVDLNKTAGVNSIPGAVTIGDGTGTDTLKLLTADQIANTSDVTISSSGVFNLNNNAETIDALNASSSTASVTLGTATLTVGANNEPSATFAGVISGTGGGLTKTGTGTQILTGTNTYTGTTTISGGTLQIGNGGTTGTLGTGGVIDNATLSFNRSNALSVSNTISGTGSLIQAGTGTTTLTGTNSYGGTTTVNAGTLLVNGNQSLATGAVTVNGSGTTLGGTGTIGGSVTVNAGANIAPGNGGNTTAILSTGALTLASNSNFLVDLNGPTAGLNYDQLNVTGAVTLTGSNLVITLATPLTLGQQFIIINNDGIDPVVGTFASVTGSNQFTVSYTGGSGNDVVLIVAAVPEPSTWLGGALAFAAVAYMQRRHFARLFKRAT